MVPTAEAGSTFIRLQLHLQEKNGLREGHNFVLAGEALLLTTPDQPV
jgi:hypothetical protein